MRSEPRCSRHWRYKSARSDVTLQQRPRRLHGISNDQISNSAFVGAVALQACGLARVQGDFLFVAIFAAASTVVIVEALRPSR